ncbi:Sulfatase [Halovenus aranensis]|uniref:Sulfatase n=2 Tax=Halovenus aranensis TaxID=890420 RepID=A0A1G8ZYL7_9EURY|nr:Sulfatase [Halovenus aranensis]
MHFMDIHAPISTNCVDESPLYQIPTRRIAKADVKRMLNIESPLYRLIYDSAVRYVDKQISEFIKHLHNTDVLADSNLIITSDHG